MKKLYAKSLKEYDGPFKFETDKILAALKRIKNAKKKPTQTTVKIKTTKI